MVLITVIQIYLGAPPYDSSTSHKGLVFLGPSIGNLLGSSLYGSMNDKLSQWSPHRNGGVIEPGPRFPGAAFPALLAPAGLLMFEIGVAHGLHWIIPVICAALVGVALTGIGSVIQP